MAFPPCVEIAQSSFYFLVLSQVALGQPTDLTFLRLEVRNRNRGCLPRVGLGLKIARFLGCTFHRAKP